MSRKLRVLLALSVLHLSIVTLGAMGIDFRASRIPPGQAIRLYGALSGANNRYGFFAPEVQTPTRASFTMTDDRGNTWHDTLDGGATSEANLRLGTIAFLLPAFGEEDQDKLTRSFVATMFGRHPGAATVELHFEAYGVSWDGEHLEPFPSAEEYRAGKRPRWLTLMSTPPFRRGDLNR